MKKTYLKRWKPHQYANKLHQFVCFCKVRSEIAEDEEEDEELNVKKVKTKQKDKYVQILFLKK